MGRIIPRVEEITIEGFREAFRNIVKLKEDSGLRAILNNPPDLFERAKLYVYSLGMALGVGLQTYGIDLLLKLLLWRGIWT
jgi:hypothetical protein